MTRAQLLQSNLDRKYSVYAPHKIYETHHPMVGFTKVARDSWRFVDLETTNDLVVIGRDFRTKRELLAAMTEWLVERGYDEPTPGATTTCIEHAYGATYRLPFQIKVF